MFDALPPGTLDAVLADDALLTAISITMLREALVAAEVVALDEIVTLNGEVITVEVIDGGAVLNGTVNVITTDINSTGLSVIDGVLRPQAYEEGGEGPTEEGGEAVDPDCPADTIGGIALANPNFSTLVTALMRQG